MYKTANASPALHRILGAKSTGIRGRYGSSSCACQAISESGQGRDDAEQFRQEKQKGKRGARSRLGEQKTGCRVTLVDVPRTKKSSISRSSRFTAFRPPALSAASYRVQEEQKRKKIQGSESHKNFAPHDSDTTRTGGYRRLFTFPE